MGKYTLDDLMRVCGEDTVTVRGRTKKVWLRTLSAAQEDTREQYALERARSVYRALQDPATPHYQAHLAWLETAPRARLEASALALRGPVMVRESMFEVVLKDDPEPPNHPTLTDIVEVEEAKAAGEKKLLEDRQAYVKAQLEAYERDLPNMELEALRAEVIRMTIDAVMRNEWQKALEDASVAYGVVKDDNVTPMFSGPEAVRELDPAYRAALLAAYNRLDVFSAQAEELKN